MEVTAKARHDHVVAFFAAVDKAVSGVRLYQGKGDLVERMFGDLNTASVALLQEGDVTVRLTPLGVVHDGEPVTEGERKPPPYFLQLFRDGVRELTLFQGMKDSELKDMVIVFSTDIRGGEDDLVTLLWNKELKHLRYYAVDSFTAQTEQAPTGAAGFSGGGGHLAESESANKRVTLAPDDLRILKADGALDWVKDLQLWVGKAPPTPQLAALQDTLRGGDDIARFVEIAVRFAARTDPDVASPLLLGAYDSVVDGRRMESIQGFLEGASTLASGGSTDSPEHRAGRALLRALLEPARMARLAPLFRDQPDPFLGLLGRFAQIDGHLLVPLLLEVGRGPAQEKLQGILRTAGIDLTAFYRSRLDDANEEVVADAILSLGKVGSKEAVEALTKALGSTLKKVRRAALEAMRGNYQEEARIYLGRILRDPSPENRLLALEVLTGSGDTRAAWLILSTVQDSQFANRDAEEQRAFMLGLAAFKDHRTIEYFEKTLLEKNLTRSEAVVARQKLAVEALVKMNNDKARGTLESMRGKWYHSKTVKDAIDQALGGR